VVLDLRLSFWVEEFQKRDHLFLVNNKGGKRNFPVFEGFNASQMANKLW
jgi:hypothetical protein